MRDLEPAEPVRRYEREHPGDMIHIDIKKLGRFNKVGHRIVALRSSVAIELAAETALPNKLVAPNPHALLENVALVSARPQEKLRPN